MFGTSTLGAWPVLYSVSQREAVGEHEPVVELALRPVRPPRLAGVEQRRDRVLVAVDVAGLEPHDEGDGHAFGRRRRVDLVARRRVLGVVWLERAAVVVRVEARDRSAVPGRALREVQELVGRLLVALLVRAPAWHVQGWICGPEKTGPPIGWLITNKRAAPPPRMRAVERHPADLQAAHAAVQAPPARAAERARHVPVARHEPEARRADPSGQLHAHQRVAAGHEVRAVREHLDPRRGHARLRRRRSEQHAGACGKGKSGRSRPPTGWRCTRRRFRGAQVSFPSAAHPW